MHTISTQNHYLLTCSHLAKYVSTTLFAYQRANEIFIQKQESTASNAMPEIGRDEPT